MSRGAAIAVFAVLAIAISALVRFNSARFGLLPGGAFSFAVPGHVLWLLLVAAGPALGAWVGWRMIGRGGATLLGRWRLGAVLSALVPVGALAVLGQPNTAGINPHLLGAFAGAVVLLYGLGEELGWRGFLGDALSGRTAALRIAVPAGLWWLWHLWFVTQSADGSLQIAYSAQQAALHLGLLLGASALFAAILRESKSLVQVAAFHAVASIGVTMPLLGLAQNARIGAGALGLAALIALHELWKRR